jgi:hypothetical protein
VSYRADYGSFSVVIGRASDSGAADAVITAEYNHLSGGSGTSIRMGNWFAIDSTSSYLGWSVGHWFYTVSVDNSATRNQAAQALISYLNQHAG